MASVRQFCASSDGDVLLGRQSTGNFNAGQAYLPGGFLDAADVSADGRICIEASIARELREETGLDAEQFERQPGFLITRAGSLLSIGIEYHADVTTLALQERIDAYLVAQTAPELDGIMFARHAAGPGDVQVPAYTQQILRHLLA